MPARRPDNATLEIDRSLMPDPSRAGIYRRSLPLHEGMRYFEARTLPEPPTNSDWWWLLRDGGPIQLRLPDGSIHGRVHQRPRANGHDTATSRDALETALGLPDFTFGVEIECIMEPGMNRHRLAQLLTEAGIEAFVSGYGHTTPGGERWKLTTDGSIRTRGRGNRYERGVELVSPILQGEEGIETISRVCKVLNDNDLRVNATCGLHVHVGAKNRPVSWIQNIMRMYHEHEIAIDTMVAPSRRASVSDYCYTTGWSDGMAAATTLSGLRAEYSMSRPMALRRRGSRFRKINLESLERHRATGGTVEFRQHHGTTNAAKIEHWVRFVLAIAERAKSNYESVLTPLRNEPPTLEEFLTLINVPEPTRLNLIAKRNKFAAAAASGASRRRNNRHSWAA